MRIADGTGDYVIHICAQSPFVVELCFGGAPCNFVPFVHADRPASRHRHALIGFGANPGPGFLEIKRIQLKSFFTVSLVHEFLHRAWPPGEIAPGLSRVYCANLRVFATTRVSSVHEIHFFD
jgi:hypothetical protein